jgi:hypothetical protein
MILTFGKNFFFVLRSKIEHCGFTKMNIRKNKNISFIETHSVQKTIIFGSRFAILLSKPSSLTPIFS